MKNPMTKLASAAVLVIAVLLISFPFNNSGVAWASLAKKIESVKTVVFHMKANATTQNMLQEQMQDQESIAYHSSKYGSRVEQYKDGKLSSIMYLNPKENLQVNVIPELQMYQNFTGKSQEELQQVSDNDDPRVMVRHIMSQEYKELGRSEINGKDVEGIECTGPGVMGGMFEEGTTRLWVEVGTDYPVRIEIEGSALGGQVTMIMVMDDFQWDVELDEALFIPDIPDNYTSQEMNISGISDVSEGAAINGLGVFAEITGGRYPKSLVFMSVMSEISEELAKKYMTDIAQKHDSDKPSLKDITQELIEKQGESSDELIDVLKITVFYNQLVGQGKNAAYYGDTVTADNPEAVLLRWRVSGDVYRVVFGDLSTGNFTTEELAELEK